MSEDTIINLLAGGTLLFAIVLSILIRNTKAHKVLTFIFYPLIKLKEWIDPNHWANKVADKTGVYEKAENTKIRKWADGLEGWKWWAWQLVGGGIFFVFFEIILNQFGMTMLPWR
jgi:hypothetical protein